MKEDQTNLERLIEGGIIPHHYTRLSKEDEAAIESLTTEEVEAIITSSHKLHAHNPDFTRENCGHGMLY